MKKKLTLSIDSSLIIQGKFYAKENKTSLSHLVEVYLKELVETSDIYVISPKVKSLSGVVKLPKKFDEKKEYRKYLENKYGK
ncbi:DUF6364 family protein [Sediminibacterium sp.]|uniref:DUF6364 family protein n=1 Tax=Sediminibacterium sp. TaxID=1917865 RepID=UPI003F702BF9